MALETVTTLATPIVERLVACVSNTGARHMRYLTQFEDTYASLMSKMSELRDLKDHVRRKVEVDESSQHMQCAPIVARWLEMVGTFEREMQEGILRECSREIEQRCCVNYCPKNWWSRYKLGKKVCKNLKIVVEVISEGQFEVVAYKKLPSRVEVKYESQSVGLHEAFSEVSSWLVDDSVKTIGIYGMGGVGKTTLLTKINNALKDKEVDTFHLIIWVTVSSQFSLQNVQKQIGKRLGLAWSDDEDQNDKAQSIFDALRKKKFVLLLDDVWEAIDFNKIAIPLQNHHSKVVFTTRLEAVCREMEVDQRFRVSILEQQQAWELFQQKVGQEALNSHPEIPKLAQKVARECGGLPLALITTGRAMSSKMTVYEWKDALTTLKNYASEFKEDWNININDIIRQWIGEGFLDKDKVRDMDDALNKGYSIIGSLKSACLLETRSTWGDSCVKMHDLVRELALWITSECGRKENKHLVQAGVRLFEAPEIEGWKDAERISLMDNYLKKLTGAPECPRLVTLMLQRNNNLSVIPDDFFCNMPILRVLDLSFTIIEVIPKSIGGLLQLQFLNFEVTAIRELPEELGKLVKLKYLNLNLTDVFIIPGGMISCFPRMQVLDLGSMELEDSLVAELESLEQLRELGITIREIPTLLSPKVTSFITRLDIDSCVGLTELSMFSSSSLIKQTRKLREMISCFPRMQVLNLGIIKLDNSLAAELESLEHLRELGIRITEIPTPLSQRLTSYITNLEIWDCVGLTEFSMFSSSSLIKQTRKLREMEIRNCSELETFDINPLEGDSQATGPLFTLETLRLWGLPKLNNIWWAETAAHLHFKHLHTVSINWCPGLKDISWLVLIPSLSSLSVNICYELEEMIVGRFTTTIDRNQHIFSRLTTLKLMGLPKLKSIVTAPLLFPRLEHIRVSNCRMLKKLPLASNSTNKSKLVIRGKEEWWNELQWEDETVQSTFQPFFTSLLKKQN